MRQCDASRRLGVIRNGHNGGGGDFRSPMESLLRRWSMEDDAKLLSLRVRPFAVRGLP
jgi:hypothetical protein